MHYKASGHAAGATGPAAALALMYGWRGAISFLLVALVVLSKIGVKEHTPGQLAAGAATAAVSMVAAFAVMGMLPG